MPSLQGAVPPRAPEPQGGRVTCRVCSALVPFASRRFCSDRIACNYRAREALGMSKRVCSMWKMRDLERVKGRRR
jgi:hypothetical protein